MNVPGAARILRWLLAGAVALGSGCVAYDSRWLQNEEEKKRAAERLRPASLGQRPGRPAGVRVATVRAHATRAYAAETLDWEQQFEALLRDANRVLEPALGITLENGGTAIWAPPGGQAELGTALSVLSKVDPGEGAHWVAGFLQSVPKLVTDYHALGMGRPFSKYFVLRGSADPREMKHLEAFEGLGEGEREKIYSERRHHKIVAVFLHELGHTLGAVHRVDRETLMSPVYDPKERGFDPATLGLLRITLPRHLDGTGVDYAAVADYLVKNPGGWVGSEREQTIAWLEPAARARPAVSASTATPAEPPPTPLPLAEVPTDDRSLYDGAVARDSRGDSRGAWTTALPLFEKHPRVLEVQELRCRLAKAQRFFAGVVEAHCERLSALVGSAVPP